VTAMGWSAVGRRYGVSDNAVRKWVRWYEQEMARVDVSEAAPQGRAA
jgi:transposase-like protein